MLPLLNMELFFSLRYLQFLKIKKTFSDFDYQSGKNFSLARNRGMMLSWVAYFMLFLNMNEKKSLCLHENYVTAAAQACCGVST